MKILLLSFSISPYIVSCVFWKYNFSNCKYFVSGHYETYLKKIPFYKEMSFECGHCGFKNNEIQWGGKMEDRGFRVTLTVQSEHDLNR
jgi:C4-type Zn-finger protein